MHIDFLQDIIDKIRKKVPLQNYIKLLGRKIAAFESVRRESINTLILGSSHAHYGYRAKQNEFNLGVAFQDLYYSYKLYEKYNNKNIKNVILFYSVFSPGSQTIKTNFSNLAAIFKVITGIDYQDTQIAKEKNLYDLEEDYKKQYEIFKRQYHFSFWNRGNEVSYKSQFKNSPPTERAAGHLKNNRRNNNQTEYVIEMQKLANDSGAEFLVVIPPATSDYRNFLPREEQLFKDLMDAQKKYNINVLNLYDTKIFSDSDFADSDHLNKKGAEKLTGEIRRYMVRICKNQESYHELEKPSMKR